MMTPLLAFVTLLSPQPVATTPLSLQVGSPGELLQNRTLEAGEAGELPAGWRTTSDASFVATDGVSATSNRSILIPAGSSVSNTGFGGVPVEKGQKYHVTIWAKGSGNVGVGFGETPVKLGKPGEGWKKLEKTIKAEGSAPNVRFVISAIGGPISVGFASLMPEKAWKKLGKDERPGVMSVGISTID